MHRNIYLGQNFGHKESDFCSKFSYSRYSEFLQAYMEKLWLLSKYPVSSTTFISRNEQRLITIYCIATFLGNTFLENGC